MRHAGRSGNVRHHSQRNLLPFQQRALFDVQLDERLVVAVRQLHLFEISAHPCFAANFLDRFSVAVLQPPGGFGREASREQPAAQASNPKARRLLRSKNQQLNRVLRTKPAPPQRAYRLKPSQNSHHAVVFPGVRNRIDMRAGADRGRRGIRASPAREGISDRVLPHRRVRPPHIAP